MTRAPAAAAAGPDESILDFYRLRRQLGWMRAVKLSGAQKVWVFFAMAPQFWALMILVTVGFLLKRCRLDAGATACVRAAMWCCGDDSALGHAYGWVSPRLLPGEREAGLTTQHMRVGMMIVQGYMDWLTNARVTDRRALMVTNGLRDRLVSTMLAVRHARTARCRMTVYWLNWRVDRYPAARFVDVAALRAAGVDVVEVDSNFDFKVPGHGSRKFGLLALEAYRLTLDLNAVADWSFFWSNPPARDDGDTTWRPHERGDFMHIDLAEIVPFLKNLGPPTRDARFTSGELLTANYGADLAVTRRARDAAWRVVYDPLKRGPLDVDADDHVITQQNDGDLAADSIANLRCLVQFQTLHVGTASSFCDVVLAYNRAYRRDVPGAPAQRIVTAPPQS